MKPFFYILCILFLTSCIKDPQPKEDGVYKNGLFIVNEGIFGQSSGSISFLDKEGSLHNNIYQKENGISLGNVVQSMHLDKVGQRAFIVVNNAEKIEVVSIPSFKAIATISSLKQPRYFLPINDSLAIVSQWGADGLTASIEVINLNNYTIQSSIPCRPGAEKMLKYQNKVFVLNNGGYSTDSIVSVIDLNSLQIEREIVLAPNPSGLVLDQQNQLWISCRGKTTYTTYPSIDSAQSSASILYTINPNNYQTQGIDTFPVASGLSHLHYTPPFLYYYQGGSFYRKNLTTLQSEYLFSGNFYGSGLSPDGLQLYTASYSGIDPAFIHQRNHLGQLIDSFQVGEFANSFVFDN